MKKTTTTLLSFVGILLVFSLVLAASSCGEEKASVSRLSIFVTGHIQGYIKNCGCSSGQYGGLMRMARLARKEREKALVPNPRDRGAAALAMLIDIGNFTDPSTDDSRINSEGIVEGLVSLDYDAIGLGMYELAYEQAELYTLLGETGLPLGTANLRFTKPAVGEDYSSQLNELVLPYRIVAAGAGFNVGVIHLIDDNVDEIIGKQNGFKITEAAPAAESILAVHGAEADYWVVTIADTRQRGTSPETLADLPGVMQVIGFRHKNPTEDYDSADPQFPVFLDPPYRNARDVVVTVTKFRQNGEPPYIESDRFAIPDEITPDDQITAIIAALAPRLEKLENDRAEEALNAETSPFYMGHDSCVTCHQDIVLHQLTTNHASAMDSLREKGQERSASCVMCHVVGHQNLPGVVTSHGWNVIEDQPEMQGVHCESCHGPGEYHVLYATSFNEPLPEAVAEKLTKDGRTEHGMLLPTEESCLVCHDELNSPNFDFAQYWKKIAHGLDTVFKPLAGSTPPSVDVEESSSH